MSGLIFSYISFVIEIVKLLIILCIGFNYSLKKPKRSVSCFFGISCSFLLFKYMIPHIPWESIFCVLLAVLILEGNNKLSYAVVSHIAVSLADLLIATLVTVLTGYEIQSIMKGVFSLIFANSISLVLLAIFAIFKKKTGRNSLKFDTQKSSYLFPMIIGELSIGGLLIMYQVMDTANRYMSFFLVVFCIIFLVICIMVIYNISARNHYKNISEINGKLMKTQEEYYKMLLEKENETRRFRHDINKHLECIRHLCEEQNYSEISDYLEDISVSVNNLKPFVNVENDMFNSILNDLIARYKDVHYEVRGKIPPNLAISSMDICTIFSNLFENAFYAANSSVNKNVEICFRFIKNNMFCSVVNSADSPVIIKDNIPTSKSDTANHGYGIYNARRSIEKNRGALNLEYRDGVFIAEISIPFAIADE